MESELHLAAFNAENFYLLLDRDFSREELEALPEAEYQGMNASIFNRNKDRGAVAEIARTILDEDFDLVGLCEVGGMESLSAFNRIYLGGRYECYLHETSSNRGIYVGALAKRGRFPGSRAANLGTSFSRNLLRLDLGPGGGDLAVLIVHLKSQYGPERGLERRIREVEALRDLAPRRGCIVMGDFNGILIPGEAQFEYESFLELPFRDVLEAVGIPPDARRTHYHFGPRGPNFAQLDYIFCSADVEVLEASVIEREIPLNKAQRALLPSDHLFIRARVRAGGSGTGDRPRAGSSLLRGSWARALELLGRLSPAGRPRPKPRLRRP